MKRSWLLVILVISILVFGCSDKKENEESRIQNQVNVEVNKSDAEVLGESDMDQDTESKAMDLPFEYVQASSLEGDVKFWYDNLPTTIRSVFSYEDDPKYIYLLISTGTSDLSGHFGYDVIQLTYDGRVIDLIANLDENDQYEISENISTLLRVSKEDVPTFEMITSSY